MASPHIKINCYYFSCGLIVTSLRKGFILNSKIFYFLLKNYVLLQNISISCERILKFGRDFLIMEMCGTIACFGDFEPSRRNYAMIILGISVYLCGGFNTSMLCVEIR